jgi:hypothetical protein
MHRARGLASYLHTWSKWETGQLRLTMKKPEVPSVGLDAGLTLEETMELIDGPTEMAPPEQIPHLSQDVPVATYRDWSPKDTRVITCRIANDIYPGTRYESREEAKAAVELVHGKVLEANYVPGRAFFRVFKASVRGA